MSGVDGRSLPTAHQTGRWSAAVPAVAAAGVPGGRMVNFVPGGGGLDSNGRSDRGKIKKQEISGGRKRQVRVAQQKAELSHMRCKSQASAVFGRGASKGGYTISELQQSCYCSWRTGHFSSPGPAITATALCQNVEPLCVMCASVLVVGARVPSATLLYHSLRGLYLLVTANVVLL